MASLFDMLGSDRETSKNIVGSLFGLSPDLVAQQQAMGNLQSSQNTAMQYAQLNPMQRAQYAMFQGASGAAGGLMGAIGPESAAVQKAKQEAMLKDAMSKQGISLDTPQGYMTGAKLALDMGLPDVAAKLGMAGAQLDKQLADAEKARRISAGDQRNNAIWEQAIIDAGGDKAKAAMNLENKEYQMDIQKRLAGRSVTNVNMAPYEKQFDIDMAKLDVDTIKEYRTAARAASQELPNIAKIDELAKTGKLYTGPISDFKLRGAEFLVSANLATPDQVAKISNSREFESAAAAGVLARIKKLGINPTDADREFATRMGPMLASNPQAIIQVNDYMRKRAMETISEAQRVQQYAVQNKGLKNFDFNPNITFGAGGSEPTNTKQGGLKSFYR